MDRALASTDLREIFTELNEGKKLLAERNRHILLAEKYGWDTVDCYSAKPLTSDSEDEKRIKNAIRKASSLNNEKRAESL